MNSIFDTLMSLPLLKGVSAERIRQVVASTPLHFLKYPEGDTIITPGSPSTHLNFIISGSVRAALSAATLANCIPLSRSLFSEEGTGSHVAQAGLELTREPRMNTDPADSLL